MEEIWKPIIGYEGLYEVSNFGRIKSFIKYKEGKILKPKPHNGGYLNVILYKKGKQINKLIHRLVAEAFIPNPDPENKTTVDHINKIRNDNRLENLQWFTQQEQVKKSYDQGRVQIISKKCKQAVKEATEIISTWINEKLNLEFIGNSLELVRAFPDQKLAFSNLCTVRRGERKQHKGWKVKEP